MDPELKSHLTRRETWLRGLFILLFALIYSTAEVVLTAVVVFQFAFVLVSGGRNPRLLAFGQQLSTYLYQVLLYMTFNRDERPWPYDAWPATPPAALTQSRAQHHS